MNKKFVPMLVSYYILSDITITSVIWLNSKNDNWFKTWKNYNLTRSIFKV